MTKFLTVLSAGVFSLSAWAQLPGPGVFCNTASGPVRLSALPLPGPRTLSWGEWVAADDRFALHYTWEGASSPVQLTERRPTFRVNLGYDPDRDLRVVQIVKLEQKSSSRGRGVRLSFERPTQFHDGVPITLSRGVDGEYMVHPEADLAPGEYMLSLGPLGMQYDFSVR